MGHFGVKHALIRVYMIITAAIVMCPADTIKTRMQFAGRLKNVKQYTSVWDALTRIPREEGFLAFTRGTYKSDFPNFYSTHSLKLTKLRIALFSLLQASQRG
jgi:hypothetical protein